MTDPVTRAVAVLNEALERDPDALLALVNLRVECNARLAAHRTIPVGLHDGVHKVGLLALLNGVLADTPGAVIGARGTLDRATGRFLRLQGFEDLRGDGVDTVA
ncbi:MAG: hypothetical protein KDE22_17260 [Rhodobacterales bacterium]|nr:hypothetical protein [Rhodobacterales bacterium]